METEHGKTEKAMLCFNETSNLVTVTDDKGTYTTSVIKYGERKQEPGGVIHDMEARFSTNGVPSTMFDPRGAGIDSPVHEFHVEEVFNESAYKVCATVNFLKPWNGSKSRQACCKAQKLSSSQFSCDVPWQWSFTLTKRTRVPQYYYEAGYRSPPTSHNMILRVEGFPYSGSPNLAPWFEKVVDVTSGQPVYLEHKGGPYIDEAILVSWCVKDTKQVLV